MSNWAKLQEDLTGLPVAKRAKHGIHFQKGDQIEAHFVGKPCHFQENGIWKPIDTALLATADGWYSSPHSDVVIHPDGRVRVKGSTYQQFTELPSAKTGKLVGDKIIRTFPGGEQWLIMKEDGFREEIHVNKQKIPVEKFIAKTTGNLPSKYKAHPITAEDAEGNSYTFTGDVAAFGAWLDKAVYPVVIDPDFGGNNTDCYIYGYNATFSTARSTSYGYVNDTTLSVGQFFSGGTFSVANSLIYFDTSSIPDTNTVAQVNLNLSVIKVDTNLTPFDVEIYKYDWSAYAASLTNATNRETAYDARLTAEADDSIWKNTNGLLLNSRHTSGNLSTAWVSKTGITYYGLRSNRDRENTQPSGNEYIHLAANSHATESYRPVLTVLYAAAGVPKHFMHYQRLRSL